MKYRLLMLITLLILVGLLVQSSYAKEIYVDRNIYFEDVQVVDYGQCNSLEINVSHTEKYVSVDVGNMYPSAHFKIQLKVKNTNDFDVVIKKVEFTPEQKETHYLYDFLLGEKNGSNTLDRDEYKEYIEDTHLNQVIKENNTRIIDLDIYLDEQLTDLENSSTKYKLYMYFEQNNNDLTIIDAVKTFDDTISITNIIMLFLLLVLISSGFYYFKYKGKI